MSGKKCATARLECKAEAELLRAIEEMRQLTDASALIARVEEMVKQVEHNNYFVFQAKTFMKKEYDQCVEEVNAFRGIKDEFNKLLHAVRNHTLVSLTYRAYQDNQRAYQDNQRAYQDNQATASQIRTDVQRTENKGKELNNAANKVETSIKDIQKNIQSRINEAEREKLIQQQRRAEIEAKISEFKPRFNDIFLQWVRERVENKLKEGKRLIEGSASITEKDVKQFAESLGALYQEGSDTEIKNQKRWEIAKRLRQAFEKSGFIIKEDSGNQYEVKANDICFSHQTQDSNLFAIIRSTIPMDHQIHLKMEGASGQDSTQLQPPDALCQDRLAEIIKRAKELGLIFESITMIGPSGASLGKILEDEIAKLTDRVNRNDKIIIKPEEMEAKHE